MRRFVARGRSSPATARARGSHRGRPAVVAALSVAGMACTGLARTDGGLFPPPPRDAVTFWGHACCYIDVAGIGIVTDPVFRGTIIARHRSIPAPPPASYAAARVVLISHAHPDHLDAATLRTFPESTVILCPAPAARYLDDAEREVRPLAPGERFDFEGGTITAVAAFHMGGRWGLSAAPDGRALGYVIETPAATIYYSGDTNFFSGFSDVGWTYQPDITLLNVNGHLVSTDAVRAALETGSEIIVPLHWGAMPYWIFGGNRRPRDEGLLKERLGDSVRVLEVGQSLPFAAVEHEPKVLP